MAAEMENELGAENGEDMEAATLETQERILEEAQKNL